MSISTCPRAPFVRDLIRAIPRRTYTTGHHASPLLRQQAFRSIRCPQSLQQCRNKGTFRGNARKLFRKHPVSMTMVTTIIVISLSGILYLPIYHWRHLSFHDYPEEVAAELRKALYYRQNDDYIRTILHYKAALAKAREVGMDHWTREIFGIKCKIADTMEAAERYDKAVLAYESIRKDNLDAMERFKDVPERKKTLTLLLRQAIEVSCKLGELYSRPEVWHREAAERHLSWAFETEIAEMLRRQRLKITEEQEGPWLSREEISNTAEQLAEAFQAKDLNYLASPLYLHAINLRPIKDCHTVVTMNNLASSLAQQSPGAATSVQAKMDSQSINQGAVPVPVSRELLLQMGQVWAKNALDLAGTITPPERTEECDSGCAVALHNLGEIAEMLKDTDGAKKHYREAISLARAIGFNDGVDASSARLRELEKK